MWEILGNKAPVSLAAWPEYDPSKLVEHEVEILIQIQGRPRARVMMPADADPKKMEELAFAETAIKAALEGKQIIKVVCVPKRIVNIVAK